MSARLQRAKFLRTQAAFLADQPWGSLLGGKDIRQLVSEADRAYDDLGPIEAALYREWNRPAVEAVLNDPQFREAAREVWGAFFGDRSDA